MSDTKVIGIDTDAKPVLTRALLKLVNEYPLLTDEITFSDISEEAGVTMVPTSNGLILGSTEDIIGRVSQNCAYSFYIHYRVSGLSENKKINVKEWLDKLGRWLEQEPISANGDVVVLTKYPEIEGTRTIKQIQRMSQAYLDNVTESLVETWALPLQATYKNEYQRKGA